MYLFSKHSARLVTISTVFILANTPLPAFGNSTGPVTESALISQGARISHHKQTNNVNFIGSTAGKPLSIPGAGISQTATDSAMASLKAYGPLFGLQAPGLEMSLTKLSTTVNGRSIARYQQTHRGLPVIGGEINVNLASNNGLLSINGEISPGLTLPTQAAITMQQAKDKALNAVAKWYQVKPSTLKISVPALSVYDPQLLGPNATPASLVWRMELTSKELKPIRELVLVNAQNGHVSLHFNQVDTIKSRATYTLNETSDPLPGTLICNETDPTCAAGTAAGDLDAVNAHLFAGDTYDFYLTTHGRDSLDNTGMTITSSTHWNDGMTCPNAFWDGSQMIYCTGLIVDDVVAHELTHGVTKNTSNLFYYYQSGAINESLSDLWGEFVDLTNGRGVDDAASRWLIGEDATILGGAIRSMADPTLYGDPDKITSINYVTSFTDNGGVHSNSGVNNKAVFLMVDGGTFNAKTVTGLGINKVAKIYYEAQTNLLTSGSDYLDLYNALYQGCQNLIGTDTTSADCVQVRTATDAVEMNLEPVVGFNPKAEICPAGTVLGTTAFFDDMENGFNKWAFTNAGSNQNWAGLNATYGVSSATSGIESLLGDNIPTKSDQRAEITVIVPGGQPYLHFNHAFHFETAFGVAYDGGIMEYSTDGGVSWSDASALIDAGQNYTGTISSCCNNTLSGRSGFTGISHGYVSSRLNLSTLAGQTVKFRWRVGTDDSVGAMGWWLDDVRVYACDVPGSIAFSTAFYSQSESGGNATITVSRRIGGNAGPASIDYAVSGDTAVEGSDYSATSGTLSWLDGDYADKSFTIPLLNDTTHENDETLSMTLTNLTGSATLGSPAIATLTITDDDPLTPPSGSAPSGGGGGGAFGWLFILFLQLLRLVQQLAIPRNRLTNS